jgi:hypothetical protein
MQNKAPWPLQNRDFVERHIIRNVENGGIQVYSQAIQDTTFPSVKNVVRGETIFGGLVIRQAGENQLSVLYLS